MPAPFPSLAIPGWIVRALCVGYVPVVLLGLVAMGVDTLVQLDRVEGRTPRPAELAFADNASLWWLLALVAIWLVSWIAFPTWLGRAYSNLPALGRSPRRSKAAAVAVTVIPGLALLDGVNAIEEVVEDGRASRRWAVSYLTYSLLTVGLFIVGFSATKPPQELAADVFSLPWSVAGLVLAAHGYSIVRRVEERQLTAAAEHHIDEAGYPLPPQEPHDFGPVEQVVTIDVPPSADTLTVRPSTGRVGRRLAPVLAIAVLVIALQTFRLDSFSRDLVLGFTAIVAAFVGTSAWLFFRNSSLFAGAGYFGHVTALGRRLAYPSSMLRAVLGLEIKVGNTISPRVIFIGPGGQVLFQLARPAWDPEQLRAYLERIQVSLDDSEAVMTPSDVSRSLGVRLPDSGGLWAVAGIVIAVALIVALSIVLLRG